MFYLGENENQWLTENIWAKKERKSTLDFKMLQKLSEKQEM